jgi:hypothetical protein
MKYILTLLLAFIFSANTFSAGKPSKAALDLESLCKQMYNIYAADEVAAKKEVLAYKKLNELIGQQVSVKITTTDSISYDRKEDVSKVKSKEVYTSDATTEYFGVFVLATQKGDNLLMSTSPDKEMSISGKISDVIVVGYIKNNVNQKAYTSLKDFDDKGTVIQQIILRVDM